MHARLLFLMGLLVPLCLTQTALANPALWQETVRQLSQNPPITNAEEAALVDQLMRMARPSPQLPISGPPPNPTIIPSWTSGVLSSLANVGAGLFIGLGLVDLAYQEHQRKLSRSWVPSLHYYESLGYYPILPSWWETLEKECHCSLNGVTLFYADGEWFVGNPFSNASTPIPRGFAKERAPTMNDLREWVEEFLEQTRTLEYPRFSRDAVFASEPARFDSRITLRERIIPTEDLEEYLDNWIGPHVTRLYILLNRLPRSASLRKVRRVNIPYANEWDALREDLRQIPRLSFDHVPRVTYFSRHLKDLWNQLVQLRQHVNELHVAHMGFFLFSADSEVMAASRELELIYNEASALRLLIAAGPYGPGFYQMTTLEEDLRSVLKEFGRIFHGDGSNGLGVGRVQVNDHHDVMAQFPALQESPEFRFVVISAVHFLAQQSPFSLSADGITVSAWKEGSWLKIGVRGRLLPHWFGAHLNRHQHNFSTISQVGIAQEMAQKNGWSLSFRSHAERGIDFTLRIPLVSPEAIETKEIPVVDLDDLMSGKYSHIATGIYRFGDSYYLYSGEHHGVPLNILEKYFRAAGRHDPIHHITDGFADLEIDELTLSFHSRITNEILTPLTEEIRRRYPGISITLK